MPEYKFTLKIQGPEDLTLEFNVPHGLTKIGRGAGSDLPLPHTQVSRNHAEIETTAETCTLTDIGSSNGTHLNGEKMVEKAPVALNPGDRVRIGPFQIEVVRTAVEVLDTRRRKRPVIDPSVVSSVEPAPPDKAAPGKPAASKPAAAAKKPARAAKKPAGKPAAKKPAAAAKKPAAAAKKAEAKAGVASEKAAAPVKKTARKAQRPARKKAGPPGPPPFPPGRAAEGDRGEPPGIPPGLEMRSHKLLQFLPGIYHNDFMARLLGIFEATLLPIEWTIDNFDLFLDPGTAPGGFLPWLSSWFGLTFDSTWTEEKRSMLLRDAHWIYSRRGTSAALRRVLEIYTGVAPEIDDQNEELEAFTFSVRVPLSKRTLRADLVEALIDAHKPAHTSYKLRFKR